MGWGFRVTCPDCGHEWSGVETSYRFGPSTSSEEAAAGGGFRSWFCPRCYYRVYIPRRIERNVWRKWYAAFQAGPDAEYQFLRKVAAKLDALLANGGWYVPLGVELNAVDCPGCSQPFHESHATAPDRLVCPRCQGRATVLDGFESHCQVFRCEPGLL